MSRAWIVDGPGFARKVTNASVTSALQIKDCGAYIECPNCSHRIDNSNALLPWPGLPKGVKFEPTDEDVIEHLEAKCGVDGAEPHMLIENFIRPVTEDVGINYTHPENLPGANKDGVSVFFIHKTVQAYGTGQRKRRKITSTGLNDEPVRWHKTGRTKPVMLNGVQKGCKKIMVLYKSSRKGSKPEKSNWVLHQYHLGTEGHETGEFVVSKITYQQPKQGEKINNAEDSEILEEAENNGTEDDEILAQVENSGDQHSPVTPKTDPTTPPPRNAVNGDGEALEETDMLDSFVQGLENIPESSFGPNLPGEGAQTTEGWEVNQIEDNLICKEDIGPSTRWKDQEENPTAESKNAPNLEGELETGCGNFAISDLDLGTPPDPLLSLASEESLLKWLDYF